MNCTSVAQSQKTSKLLPLKTYLDTFTHTKVFWDERVFITVASSVTIGLEVNALSLKSSEVFDTWPDELETENDDIMSVERVRCSPGTCSESEAAFLKSLKDLDVAVFRSWGIPRRLESTDLDDGRSVDTRRGV